MPDGKEKHRDALPGRWPLCALGSGKAVAGRRWRRRRGARVEGGGSPPWCAQAVVVGSPREDAAFPRALRGGAERDGLCLGPAPGFPFGKEVAAGKWVGVRGLARLGSVSTAAFAQFELPANPGANQCE